MKVTDEHFIEFAKAYKSRECRSFPPYGIVYPTWMADWLIDNKQLVLDFLNAEDGE